jgi:hypothetical protein
VWLLLLLLLLPLLLLLLPLLLLLLLLPLSPPPLLLAVSDAAVGCCFHRCFRWSTRRPGPGWRVQVAGQLASLARGLFAAWGGLQEARAFVWRMCSKKVKSVAGSKCCRA